MANTTPSDAIIKQKCDDAVETVEMLRAVLASKIAECNEWQRRAKEAEEALYFLSSAISTPEA